MQNLKRVFLVLIVLLFTSACSQEASPGVSEPEKEADKRIPPFEKARVYQEDGFSFFYPENWGLLAEEKVQGSITLRLQEKGNSSAQVIISYFPGAGSTNKEILQQAENLLKGSLFRIKGKLDTREERIGDRVIPIIYAQAGETEIKVVQTAVMTGDKGYLFTTLITSEEDKGYFIPIFRLLLEGMEVK
jgi:hypothetical protein